MGHPQYRTGPSQPWDPSLHEKRSEWGHKFYVYHYMTRQQKRGEGQIDEDSDGSWLGGLWTRALFQMETKSFFLSVSIVSYSTHTQKA